MLAQSCVTQIPNRPMYVRKCTVVRFDLINKVLLKRRQLKKYELQCTLGSTITFDDTFASMLKEGGKFTCALFSNVGLSSTT